MTQQRFLAAALLAGALAAGGPVLAVEGAGTATAPTVTITQAIATAEQHGNGRAVEAELERSARGAYYEVKVVGGDGVREIHIDAADGKVLATKEKKKFDDDDDDDDDDD